MTYEQMLVAMRAAGNRTLSPHMIEPGKWICRLPGCIGGDGMLTSTFGSGKNPEEAVTDAWDQCVNLPEDRYLQVENRRVRWNGFMWEDFFE